VARRIMAARALEFLAFTAARFGKH